MVIKRIRTEYMKKFKDPKWETYSKCYDEMLKYRLARRLLEHTHNPWFWNGVDSDSGSSGSRSPPNKNQVEPGSEAPCGGGGPPQTSVSVPKIPLPLEDGDERIPQTSAANGKGVQSPGAGETRVLEEEREEEEESSGGNTLLIPKQREREQERGSSAPGYPQTRPSHPCKPPRHGPRVRPAGLQKPTEVTQETRHPFALYGWGERQADMASRKTHNVGPVTSTMEIHESALRAKTRREVERNIQTRRGECRRAKSADLDQIRTKVVPEFNPWLTEYMRCFSAHSR